MLYKLNCGILILRDAGFTGKFRKILLKNFVGRKKSINFATSNWESLLDIALWCNGSTPDSGSVCESSSLSKATEIE